MRRLYIISSIAAGHFVITFWLMLNLFGQTMSRFDDGTEPDRVEIIMNIVLEILMTPMEMVIEIIPVAGLPGLWGYIPFLLNSLLWGVVLYFLYMKFKTIKM